VREEGKKGVGRTRQRAENCGEKIHNNRGYMKRREERTKGRRREGLPVTSVKGGGEGTWGGSWREGIL